MIQFHLPVVRANSARELLPTGTVLACTALQAAGLQPTMN